MDIFDSRIEIPLGLGMALAKNTDAMAYFASLTPQHQREVIERTHGLNSKKEMEQFVRSMGNNGMMYLFKY